jgi:hypothetical protein
VTGRRRTFQQEESGSRSYPSLRPSGSAISRYRQLYTHGLCFQGLRCTADTAERQTSGDTTRYASGEHPGPWQGMNRPNARLGLP